MRLFTWILHETLIDIHGRDLSRHSVSYPGVIFFFPGCGTDGGTYDNMLASMDR